MEQGKCVENCLLLIQDSISVLYTTICIIQFVFIFNVFRESYSTRKFQIIAIREN